MFGYFYICTEYMVTRSIFHPKIVEYFGRSEQGLHMCLDCGWTSDNTGNLRSHVESKHFSPGYKCRFCAKSFKLRNTRGQHEKRICKLRR